MIPFWGILSVAGGLFLALFLVWLGVLYLLYRGGLRPTEWEPKGPPCCPDPDIHRSNTVDPGGVGEIFCSSCGKVHAQPAHSLASFCGPSSGRFSAFRSSATSASTFAFSAASPLCHDAFLSYLNMGGSFHSKADYSWLGLGARPLVRTSPDPSLSDGAGRRQVARNQRGAGELVPPLYT